MIVGKHEVSHYGPYHRWHVGDVGRTVRKVAESFESLWQLLRRRWRVQHITVIVFNDNPRLAGKLNTASKRGIIERAFCHRAMDFANKSRRQRLLSKFAN